ncbi:hypothetical protein [Alkalicoccus luteus]|uniref:Uncharacterized protein n=1 Tax=Alkalicoccus luteus TaxID=1237094 RepID=A0A969PV03_9BACI|nr:hypothetical protein [Alkalicoccus luteus]NJP36167.1 hypothetical protein [Alkalicoccus luteus]
MELTRREKQHIFLLRPLVMTLVAIGTLFLLEAGIPDWPIMLGITTGLFAAPLITALFFPKLLTKKRRENPTRKQKIGRTVFFSAGGLLIFFILIRFFWQLAA